MDKDVVEKVAKRLWFDYVEWMNGYPTGGQTWDELLDSSQQTLNTKDRFRAMARGAIETIGAAK